MIGALRPRRIDSRKAARRTGKTVGIFAITAVILRYYYGVVA
jgi:hypothetical protein